MERIVLHGVSMPTAWPVRSLARRLGATGFWGLAATVLLVGTHLLLAAVGAPSALYFAFALSSLGFFLCTWGSLYGVDRLLGELDAVALALDGATDEIRSALVEPLKCWVAPRRTASVASVFGAGITGCMLVHNFAAPETAFASAFAGSHGALYVPVFLAALSIGLAIAAIVGALAVGSRLACFKLRRTYVPDALRGLSRTYLWLATLALATYVAYLAFLPVAAFSGLELTFSLNAWAVVVGAVVLLVYLYPQWAIHRLLAKNRAVLVHEAIVYVEALSSGGVAPDAEGWEKVLRALDYVRAMESFPTVAFRWKELAALVVGYVLPVVGFLLSQAPFLEAWFR